MTWATRSGKGHGDWRTGGGTASVLGRDWGANQARLTKNHTHKKHRIQTNYQESEREKISFRPLHSRDKSFPEWFFTSIKKTAVRRQIRHANAGYFSIEVICFQDTIHQVLSKLHSHRWHIPIATTPPPKTPNTHTHTHTHVPHQAENQENWKADPDLLSRLSPHPPPDPNPHKSHYTTAAEPTAPQTNRSLIDLPILQQPPSGEKFATIMEFNQSAIDCHRLGQKWVIYDS